MMENLSTTMPTKTRASFLARLRQSRFLPYMALASGILALSLSSLFIRWADAPGTITSFYRMLVAVIVMLPFFVRQTNRAGWSSLPWKWAWLPLLGGLASSLDHAVWSTAIGFTKVANATLLNNISPVWVALIAFLFFKERLSIRFWIGLLFALTGAGVVFSHDLLTNPQVGRGDLMALGSSVFYAGYFLFTQRGRKYFDTFPYVFLAALSCAFFLLIFNLLLGNPLSGYSAQTYLMFLAAGLISQLIGYFSLSYALGHLSAAVVSPTMIAQPVLTALLAIPFANEALLPAQWIGGLVVLTGIYLVNKR